MKRGRRRSNEDRALLVDDDSPARRICATSGFASRVGRPSVKRRVGRKHSICPRARSSTTLSAATWRCRASPVSMLPRSSESAQPPQWCSSLSRRYAIERLGLSMP